MKRPGRKAKIDADLDKEVDHYELSDSDDGFDEEERCMLNNAVGRKQNEEEQEVLKIYSSSEDSDENEESGSEKEETLYGGGVGSDLDSDIEEKVKDDGLPDAKAWGSDRKQYYHTDYVDKDYLGFDNEEAAMEEEKEADSIQKRLLAQLEGTDFSFGLLDEVEDKKKEAAKKKEEPEIEKNFEEEIVNIDLSKLTHEEALQLLMRESPELFPIIDHCKSKVFFLKNKIWPILKLVKNGTLKNCKATKMFKFAEELILHYAMNVLFYLHLKENGEPTHNHPVMKRLKFFQILLSELDVLLKKVDGDVDMILATRDIKNELVLVEESMPIPNNRKEKRKRKLELLKKKEQEKEIGEAKKRHLQKLQASDFIIDEKKIEDMEVQYVEEEDHEDCDDEEESEGREDEKRGVTFNILKNRGLTPKRKKENRNPRVKNRNKYKKALKRRKGQFREPRKELKKYGGEISGIKKNISKSIKLK